MGRRTVDLFMPSEIQCHLLSNGRSPRSSLVLHGCSDVKISDMRNTPSRMIRSRNHLKISLETCQIIYLFLLDSYILEI